MIDFTTLARRRCSVRSYSDRTVEPEKLSLILEAIQLAPSACNNQPWRFVIIREQEGLDHLHQCYDRAWFKTAPMAILACGLKEEAWVRQSDGKDALDIDVAIATEHLCLAAASLGLGTCWICNFDATRCRELFHLPPEVEPIAIIPIGYPSDPDIFEKTPKNRKPFSEIFSPERF